MRRSWARRSRLYLMASVLLAVAAGLSVRAQVARYATAAAASRPEVPVVVAAEPLVRGRQVRADQLTVRLVPRAFVPPGALSKIEEAAGRVALGDLLRGEAVTETRLARVRGGPVASLIPEGLRAFAVPATFPAGAIAVGDRIDVLATYGAPQPHTETVVSMVEVLFVLGEGSARLPRDGPDSAVQLDAAGSGAGSSSLLILLVSPGQEERLAYARAFGNLEVTVVSAAEGA